MKPLDMLVVGSSMAGLAAAIRFKQKKPKASVVVIDKAMRPGGHALSGAIMETACLDELLPGWQKGDGSPLSWMMPVTRDEMFFLTPQGAYQIPPLLVPAGMRRLGDKTVSAAQLAAWLYQKALGLGVEVYHGFAAAALVWESATVIGVRLVDQGLALDGKPGSAYLAGEEILAQVTVLADGASGVLSREYAARVGGRRNPQVYSVGVKQVFRLKDPSLFESGRVVSTLGFPCRPNVFGGGFIYRMNEDLVAVGLILGLDWQYQDLNPALEFEIFKAHPWVASVIKGAHLVEAGAKIIPEGGFYALPQLSCPGAMVAGDAAGFVNMQKIKGIHYAILSGMSAADAVLGGRLEDYEDFLKRRGVWRDMRGAKNFRACFKYGLLMGAPLSQVQEVLPWRIPMGEDYLAMCSGSFLAREKKGTADRALIVSLSGTSHREGAPSHLVIRDASKCQRCAQEFKSPCTLFCPAEVYRRDNPEEPVRISALNCLHCGTCSIKCPLDNIRWVPPEGGFGPRYTLM